MDPVGLLWLRIPRLHDARRVALAQGLGYPSFPPAAAGDRSRVRTNSAISSPIRSGWSNGENVFASAILSKRQSGIVCCRRSA